MSATLCQPGYKLLAMRGLTPRHHCSKKEQPQCCNKAAVLPPIRCRAGGQFQPALHSGTLTAALRLSHCCSCADTACWL